MIKRPYIYTGIGLIVVGALSLKPICNGLGAYLVYESDMIQPTTYLIVLSGDSGQRTREGIRLYHEGKAEKLVFTGGIMFRKTASYFMKEYALELGVPSSNIIEEPRANSTYENATYSKEIIDKSNSKTITIVTSSYHTKRSYLTFKKVFGPEITIQVKASDKNTYAHWWRNHETIQLVLSEWVKIIIYRLKGYL